MIKLLETVKVPKSLVILAAVSNAATIIGILTTIVTSGNDSVHMKGSKHYTDEALDFRTHDLLPAEKDDLCALALHRLGEGYQGFIEDRGGPNEHLHIEWDPKKGS
jgi:hypothetical protein